MFRWRSAGQMLNQQYQVRRAAVQGSQQAARQRAQAAPSLWCTAHRSLCAPPPPAHAVVLRDIGYAR